VVGELARGHEFATRPFMTEDFQQVNVVTNRLHKIAWKKSEFQHLVRILETIRPEMTQAFQSFDRCRPFWLNKSINTNLPTLQD
jgi:hypothetical protein